MNCTVRCSILYIGSKVTGKVSLSVLTRSICGAGMAKKQAARDQRAHEEAIASGMIKLKGSGKKRAAPTSIEKGLLEDGGLFKAGMLRVKGSASKGAKFKKAPSNTKRAFSSAKIGDLNSNSQKAWNKAQQRNTQPTSRKARR